MEFTRRYWASVGVGVFLAVGAVVLAQPVLLFGAIGISAWLLAQQYLFVRTVSETVETLSVTQSLDRSTVNRGEGINVALSVQLPDTSPVNIELEPNLPITATYSNGTDGYAVISTGERDSTSKYSMVMSVGGAFELPPPKTILTDEANLFRTTTSVGEAQTITVDTGYPGDVHVGVGGERVAGMDGNSEGGSRRTGITPDRIREYAPGDSLRQIDWNATARLGHPHVREFEPEMDSQTVVLIDHSGSMSTGQAGKTKLDYARQVALSFVNYTRSKGEPLGLYAVDGNGLTANLSPSADRDHYATIRTELHDLVSSDTRTRPSEPLGVDGRSLNRTYQVAKHLQKGNSAFETLLRPFFDESRANTSSVEIGALYEAVRDELAQLRGSTVTVILSDDTNRKEIRELVKLAQQQNNTVLVFLTPTVLFEESSVATVKNAYERYVNFESFRREIARINNVQAFEVGPGDELERLLRNAQTHDYGRTNT
ncbi:DUF58 domain-containing protein [Haladaptatus sp. DFWS20]|uniref:DUF58 domain-containing protein n=1 Tax=Haladaptatus sp. DFWS20 TaxID=3403467 RepID=UPI003EC0EDBF